MHLRDPQFKGHRKGCRLVTGWKKAHWSHTDVGDKANATAQNWTEKNIPFRRVPERT